jgi:tRNA (guanine-N7-)-methyltransferase
MRPLPLTDLSPWFQPLHEFVEQHGRMEWSKFFGNDHPVEIDVGCGRGLFVYTAAKTRPQTNFLGIELDFKEARRGARRLQKIESPNGRIFGGDVFQAFEKVLPPKSVDAIHVYFPDPWWKRRHRSRRVFNDRFVDLAVNLLKPRGYLHSWTDVEEYFGVISALMNNDPRFETLPPPDERAPQNDFDYHTSFERKKRKLGLPIFRGMWRLRN